MAVLLSPVGGVAGQFFDNNGNPLTGGKMYSYVAGTTTPQATYTSSAGVVAHSNPIILDAGGRVPGGEIWLTDGLQYKFVLKNANDVLIGTYDNIVGINSNFVNFLTETEVQTATAGQTVFTLTTMQYQPGTNNLTVYVDGVNQIDGASYSYVETSSTVITFTAGLHVGALVKFTTAQSLSTGVTSAALVGYEPAGTGAVATTVQVKLRETVSVKDFGATGDGVTDDAVAIQSAINAVGNAGGGVVQFPEGTYLVGTSLTWTFDGITLQGDGIDVTIIRDHSSLGANPIFSLVGTSGNYISNTSVTNLTIRNGTASTGSYTINKDGIKLRYVDNFNFTNSKITEIQGTYGIQTKYCTNIKVINCIFYRCTYSCFTVLVECENVWVQNCTFDTTTSTTSANTYLFATGGDTLGEGTFGVKNLWVQDSVFLNNLTWEGIDSHGVENCIITGNYVENCRMGIMLGLVAGYWANPVLKNCTISSNIIVRGTGVDNQSGIVINGEIDATNLYMAENIVITNNSISGFGGSSSFTVGSITLYNVKNVVVENNIIDDFAQSGITLYYNVWNARILNNFIQDCRGGAVLSSTAAIQFNSTGLINIIVDENTLNPRTVAKGSQYFLRSTTAEGISSQIGTRNRILYTISGSFYANVSTLPVNKSASPTYPTSDFLMAVGGVVNDTTYKPGWVCSAVGFGVIGYGSTDTVTSLVLATATAGSSTVTVVNSTRDYRAIAPGTCITITGAGSAGADLNCLVTSNNKSTITISGSIITSVTNAVVKYQGVTFTTY